MVWHNAMALLENCGASIAEGDLDDRVEQLKDLMVSFGELTKTGKYDPDEGEDGFENARSRAGFKVLPGVDAGVIADALSLDTLLDSEFWKKTRFYQPVDFLWQPTLFQPVGGMDQVQHSFAQQVAACGAHLHLNSPIKLIEWDCKKREFVVHVSQVGTDECIQYRADYCFSNIAIPFLSRILSEKLQTYGDGGFDQEFKASLRAVYDAQFKPTTPPVKGYVPHFLANTTKVGWQGDRSLWQGSPMQVRHDDCGEDLMVVPDSEIGVVPIFGGISWTNDEIVQIWYPSNAYHDDKGVLTGAYNFADVAERWGKKSVKQRLKMARDGAKKFGKKFGDGLHDGVAIAWQNMPYIKGGWAQWQAFNDPPAAVKAFNVLVQGTGVDDSSHPVFFIVGDQVSSLPGWQEGAIASALNAISRMARPDLQIHFLSKLPDTRLMVEGI
jgi:monoamine oxidase